MLCIVVSIKILQLVANLLYLSLYFQARLNISTIYLKFVNTNNILFVLMLNMWYHTLSVYSMYAQTSSYSNPTYYLYLLQFVVIVILSKFTLARMYKYFHLILQSKSSHTMYYLYPLIA